MRRYETFVIVPEDLKVWKNQAIHMIRKIRRVRKNRKIRKYCVSTPEALLNRSVICDKILTYVCRKIFNNTAI
jgi:hypothetical protein